MADWTFSDAPNVAVFTTQQIVRKGAWISHVFHDADDGAWQFHHRSIGDPSESEAMMVSLHSMVLRDATLNELADLPVGWRAWRNAPTAPWQRVKVE